MLKMNEDDNDNYRNMECISERLEVLPNNPHCL